MPNIYYFDTKKAAVAFFKDRITTNIHWAAAAVKTLLEYQTPEELAAAGTLYHNDAGLQPKHAKICMKVTSAHDLMQNHTLWVRLQSILPHYAGQLVAHCRNKGTVVIRRKTGPRRKRTPKI